MWFLVAGLVLLVLSAVIAAAGRFTDRGATRRRTRRSRSNGQGATEVAEILARTGGEEQFLDLVVTSSPDLVAPADLGVIIPANLPLPTGALTRLTELLAAEERAVAADSDVDLSIPGVLAAAPSHPTLWSRLARHSRPAGTPSPTTSATPAWTPEDGYTGVTAEPSWKALDLPEDAPDDYRRAPR